jgi:hypothetical protein
MTTQEAIDALERVVRATHFPRSRGYRIEWMEDSYRVIHYSVYITSLEMPHWEAFGHGHTLADAVQEALSKVPWHPAKTGDVVPGT